MSGSAGDGTLERPAPGTLVLAAALALPLALWRTAVHVVPTSAGLWRGVSDPPTALRIALSVLMAAALALVLSRQSTPARRPMLLMWLAAAPLVPLVTGRLLQLLAFQGPVLALLAASVLCAALAGAAGGPAAEAPLPPPTGPDARPWRPRARGPMLFAAAFLFYALLGTRFPGPAGPQGDEPHYLVMTVSLLTDGDLDLADEFRDAEYAAFFAGTLEPHTSPASPPGRVYSIHAPGLPMLLLPAYVLGGHSGTRLFMSAVAALTGLLVFGLVRESLKDTRLATAAWAALTFTPPLPFYAVSLYPEVPAALATALFLRTTRRDPGAGAMALATLAAVALPWLHPKFLPLAGLGLGLTMARRSSWRGRGAALLVFVGSLILLLLFFRALYGRAALSAAYGPGFSSDVSLARAPWGGAALVFDRQFGLLAVSPLWALAAPGWVALLRRRPGDGLRAALLGGAGFLAGASFSMWWGGASPPGRFVVPALPALALAVAPALSARRRLSAGLGGLGLAVLAVAAEAPRALHNRADGESALLRFLAPGLNLDASLPSFVLGGIEAPLLALTLAGALALAWARGPKGLLVGGLAYAVLAGSLRERGWIDERGAALGVLAVWDEGRLRGVTGPLDLSAISIGLDLPGAPWTIDALDVRNSRRLDLPPGLYHVEMHGRVLEALATAHVVRLDLTAGELLLARTYLREGRPAPSLPLLLPAGARRLTLTAAGIQGKGLVEDVRLVPEAVVPAGLRSEFPWPRSPLPERYRVGSGEVRVTALDRSEPEGEGFRIEGEAGSFLIEVPEGREALLRLSRPRPTGGDAVVWGGRAIELRGPAELALVLPPLDGVRLGPTAVVPLRVRSQGAWVAVGDATAEGR